MNKNSNNDNDSEKKEQKLARTASSLGMNIAVGMFIFFYIGYRLELKYGQSYWTLGGIGLGLFYLGYQIWKLIKDINQKS